jgi:hypothetical protein
MVGDKMQIAPKAQQYLPKVKTKSAGTAPGLESHGSRKETSRKNDSRRTPR